jgi:hypothetical protein
MLPATPHFAYLVKIGDQLRLQDAQALPVDADPGDYIGEWGSHLDTAGRPVGVRLMHVSEEFRRHTQFLTSRNISEDDGDLVVHLIDARLPAIECMPYLPVYRSYLPDGREILGLHGYE